MGEDSKTCSRAAASLSRAARMLESLYAKDVSADERKAVAACVASYRRTAGELRAMAERLRPSAALVAWNKGNAAASRNWNPTPVKPRG